MLNIFSCAYIFFWEIRNLSLLSFVACAFGVIERNYCQIQCPLYFLQSFILLSLTRGLMHILVLFLTFLVRIKLWFLGIAQIQSLELWHLVWQICWMLIYLPLNKTEIECFTYFLLASGQKFFYTHNDLLKNVYG